MVGQYGANVWSPVMQLRVSCGSDGPESAAMGPSGLGLGQWLAKGWPIVGQPWANMGVNSALLVGQ